MGTYKYAPETLHIALVSLSQGQAKNHIDSLIREYYDSYKKDILYYSKEQSPKSNSYLYQPLAYYIFGNYDIALISVINNYKFSQKQPTVIQRFESSQKSVGGKNKKISQRQTSEPSLFQVITGSCPIISDGFSVQKFFEEKQKNAETFICITNLKLNNKLLIGNGKFLLEPIFKIIDRKIKEIFKVKFSEITHKYFLQQTYSWSEITVVVFADNIEEITNVVTSLRKLTLNNLFDSATDKGKINLLENSLYKKVLKKSDYIKANPDLFADSHSHFGINTNTIERKVEKEIGEQKLNTQIEWQVKPGHFESLLRTLKENQISGTPDVFSDEAFFLTGKTDFFIPEKDDSVFNNIALIKRVVNDSKKGNKSRNIFDHARKVKSKILLDYSKYIDPKAEFDPFQISFKKYVKKHFLDTIPDASEINNILKSLKISRNIRSKIVKIFFNYQNGIQDPILFTYFLDFKIYINNLTNFIREQGSVSNLSFSTVNFNNKYENRSVNEVENLLIKMIEIFEEGYNIRLLNSNQYEDINDFDLDFNSSVQQILSMYGTLAIKLGNIFFEKNKHGPVVQLNLKNTVSNLESINYDVYHLTCPEFVLFTLVKEVINKYVYLDELTNLKKSKSDRNIKEIISLLKSNFFECTNFYDDELVDFESYYFIDAVRFIHTCNFDFDLFQYWFWTHTFQNASLYDKTGTFNERQFRMEILRLFFVARLFGISLETIQCPLPEIYYLWERHVKSFIETINCFFEYKENDNINLISDFKVKILSVFKYSENFEAPVMTMKLKSFEQKIRKHITACLSSADRLQIFGNNYSQIANLALQIFTRKNNFYKKIENGIPVYCYKEEEQGYFFINSFIYSYLKLIYDKNGKVRLLRRNWEDGKPLLSFIKQGDEKNDEFLYSVDQYGGIFFSSEVKSEEYFKIRNATLQSIWHFSLLAKKSIYYS